jgi:Zn-dependent peptidase ImmA (M78 family)
VNRRDAVLEGALRAARLHQRLDIVDQIKRQSGNIDIFAAIVELDVELVFRPLDGLLGAYVAQPWNGIIVTTERSLAIQRFTAAHELGHWAMTHHGSLDDESILHRSPSGQATYTVSEIAADAFAAAFLTPDWLFTFHADRQGWDRRSLSDAQNVYQMALRVGVSYEATCRSLERYKVIDGSTLNSLLDVQPKKLKQALLRGYEPETWHGNVWALTEKDAGTRIQGEPGDLFIVRLKENSGAGYLWNIDELKAVGFALVSDERAIPSPEEDVGGAVDRVLTARSEAGGVGSINLVEARPWQLDAPIAQFSLRYDIRGRESGMPRAARERSAAA